MKHGRPVQTTIPGLVPIEALLGSQDHALDQTTIEFHEVDDHSRFQIQDHGLDQTTTEFHEIEPFSHMHGRTQLNYTTAAAPLYTSLCVPHIPNQYVPGRLGRRVCMPTTLEADLGDSIYKDASQS